MIFPANCLLSSPRTSRAWSIRIVESRETISCGLIYPLVRSLVSRACGYTMEVARQMASTTMCSFFMDTPFVVLFKRLTKTYRKLVALGDAALVQQTFHLALIGNDAGDVAEVHFVALLEDARLLVLVDDEGLARYDRLQDRALDFDFVRLRGRDRPEEQRVERIGRQDRRRQLAGGRGDVQFRDRRVVGLQLHVEEDEHLGFPGALLRLVPSQLEIGDLEEPPAVLGVPDELEEVVEGPLALERVEV